MPHCGALTLSERKMGKIYYVMGKSATGKDTIFTRLLEECPKTNRITLYTTRPRRDEEKEGIQYNYVTEEELSVFEQENRLIEKRTYQTVHGPWTYATVDDHLKERLEARNFLIIGTLESFKKIKAYFGEDVVIPIYIQVDPGIRLQRAINREFMQKRPRYAEMCRRFLADEEDFSEEKLKEAGIKKRYINENLNRCVEEIKADMEPPRRK